MARVPVVLVHLVDVPVAVVPVAEVVDSRHVPVAEVVDSPAVRVAHLVVPVDLAGLVAVAVRVLVVAVPPRVHSDVPVANPLAAARASAPSVKNSTTCQHPHPRVRFGRWARGRRSDFPVGQV